MIPPAILGLASYWRLIVGAVLVGLLAAQTVRLAREQASHSQTIATHKAEKLEASEKAREAYILASRARTGVDNAHQAELQRLRPIAAADRRTADGVRDAAKAIASAAADPGATGCTDERRALEVLAGLVGEVGPLVAAGKEGAGRLAAQTAGLQDFVGKVCVAQPSRIP